jgi:hypothetical protein
MYVDATCRVTGLTVMSTGSGGRGPGDVTCTVTGVSDDVVRNNSMMCVGWACVEGFSPNPRINSLPALSISTQINRFATTHFAFNIEIIKTVA